MIVKIQKLRTIPRSTIREEKSHDLINRKPTDKQITYIQCKKCNMIISRQTKIDYGLRKTHQLSIPSIKNIVNARCSLDKNVSFFCRKCGKQVGRLNRITNLIQVCQESVKCHYIYLRQNLKEQKKKLSESYEYSGIFQGIKPKYIHEYVFKSLFYKCQKYKLCFEINEQILAKNNLNFYRRALFLLQQQYIKRVNEKEKEKEKAKEKEKQKAKSKEQQEMKYMQSTMQSTNTKAQTSEHYTKMFKTLKNNILSAEQLNKS